MQLVIIAGGKGTRLQELSGGLPKPMIDVGGKPLLEHQILLGRKYGIRDVLLLTGYGAEHIERYFETHPIAETRICSIRETQPLGTAGALLNAFDQLQDTFLLLCGDILLNVDLSRLLASHPADAAASLFVHPNQHPYDSDVVELNAGGWVQALHAYPHPRESYFPNLVNAALHVMSKKALVHPRERWLQQVSALDICRNLFPQLLAEGHLLKGYRSREYLKDAGTPDRLRRVRADYEAGRIAAGSWETAVPAVFLDRDGTLNYDHGWIHAPEQTELLPGAREAVRAINESGRLAVVITNQPVIARGECSETQLRRIHDRLEWQLGEGGAYLDGLYYCPHHPQAGFPGERPELKRSCACRKPETGLLQAAVRDLNIDLSRSWMVGDSASDFEAAHKLGISAALVDRNQEFNVQARAQATRDGLEPQLKACTVEAAVSSILKQATGSGGPPRV